MNKTVMGIIIAVVVVAVAALLYYASAPPQQTTTPRQTPPATTSTATTPPTATTTQTTATTSPTATSTTSAAPSYKWTLIGMYIAADDKVVKGQPPAQQPPSGYLTPVIVDVKPTEAPNVVEIGVLQPLSGRLASLGELAAAAARLAEQDVNAYLTKINATFRVRVVVADTAADPTKALDQMKALHSRGVKFYVVRTSGEVRTMKPYADENKLVTISISSTAPALAIPNDYIFRLPPDDNKQVRAISKILQDAGVKAVVVIWRNDDWGNGLVKGLESLAQSRGFEVVRAATYDPQKGEFSTEVSVLAQRVRDAVSKYGADKVAVAAFGFAELQTIFITAAKYPELRQVKWYGADGSTGLKELLVPDAAEFAVAVGGFVSPKFAPARSPYYDRVRNYILQNYNREPDSYAYNAYDAIWLIAYSILQAGTTDTQKIQQIFPEVAGRYFGASGYTKLNEAGDRDSADYEIWAITKS
ncbi:ABC transporter substrate-binding protein [Pyrobaculum sp.]|uniref:ABC transporter substrate-binding protein n=1 Tax=Pyrobaculum sp. TaxID=2004705 RepID=UPI003D0EF8D9